MSVWIKVSFKFREKACPGFDWNHVVRTPRMSQPLGGTGLVCTRTWRALPRRVDLVLPPPGTRDFSGGRADSPLSLMVIAASRLLLISASFPGHLSRLSRFQIHSSCPSVCAGLEVRFAFAFLRSLICAFYLPDKSTQNIFYKFCEVIVWGYLNISISSKIYLKNFHQGFLFDSRSSYKCVFKY